MLEILDLSLHVVRDHVLPLTVLWLVGVVPFAAADWFATRWITADYFEFEYLTLYFFTMSFLIIGQAQIATIFMTTYLGQALFAERPSIWSCIVQTLRVNPWLYWFQGIYRCVIPAYVTVLSFSENTRSDDFALLYTLFVCLVLLGLVVRIFRPFANEILLLEKTPIREKYPNQITYRKRSAGLHSVADTDRLSRFITLMLFSILFTGSLFGTIILIDSWLNLHATDTSVPALIYLPLSMWMVAGLLAVARYLSYIDIRIRQEGWEVELRMRTESMRIRKALS